MKLYKILTAVFAVLTLCSLIYIFFNGTQNSVKSNERSDNVASTIKPIVDSENKVEKTDFSYYVRKSAHAVEFFALGSFSGLTAVFFYLAKKKTSFLAPFSLVMLSAVADEFVQSFSGRTGSVNDIVIDIAGGVLGYLAAILVLLTIIIVNKIKKRG